MSAEAKSRHNEIRQYYDEVYYGDTCIAAEPTRHLRQLAARLNIHAGQKVLDVACGKGEWLIAAGERGGRVYGIDISRRAINVCRAMMPQGEFYVGGAESLPFADDQFDAVSCLGSLEHFLHPELALREMCRVARRDAVLLLLVPNANFLTRRLGLFSGTEQVDIHEEPRTLPMWQHLFEVAGLQVDACWPDLHILSWPWIRSGPWYMAPARLLQAIMLLFWPLSWQYQAYFLCRKESA
jgi:SAM-dependent methyltransferase